MPKNEATLYRLPNCPYGKRARELLDANGYTVDDHILDSHGDAEAFMQKQGVESTPQVFIDGQRIGGSEALEDYLAHHASEAGLTSPNLP
jgi:glutaredoxin